MLVCIYCQNVSIVYSIELKYGSYLKQLFRLKTVLKGLSTTTSHQNYNPVFYKTVIDWKQSCFFAIPICL